MLARRSFNAAPTTAGQLFVFFQVWKSERRAGPEAHWAEPHLVEASASVSGFPVQAWAAHPRTDLRSGSREIVKGPWLTSCTTDGTMSVVQTGELQLRI
jgi:hypothetical protein